MVRASEILAHPLKEHALATLLGALRRWFPGRRESPSQLEEVDLIEEVGRVRKKTHLEVTISEEYAKSTIPWMAGVFLKDTYSELFQLALGTLALHARVLEKGHRLVEVDAEGRPLCYVAFPDTDEYGSNAGAPINNTENG